MADKAGNWTSISSNSSNNTVTHATYDSFLCSVGFYVHVGLICITILPFNIWALRLIKKSATHRSLASSELLHFNLVCASMMFCIAYVTGGLLTFFFTNSSIFLNVWIYILDISIMAQVQFYTWICVERFLAVVHPIVYHKMKQSWYKMVWVTFTWVTSSLFAGLCLFIERKITVFLLMITLCGLMVLILFCGVPTLARLKNRGEGERVKKMHHQKIKAFRSITLTLVVVILTYCPYIFLVFLWQDLHPEIRCIAQTILVSLLLPGAVFHSLLYIFCFYTA